ncbi:LysM peptidoglycan-binding domain-containing protein [Actinomadura sp. SCN-SB]|uniref:LysM peptidoglycan-binding domain-containing protein n=1 Tax=Actinomadura sp. SCN-SB TaxID=3373092 RepID=UPI003751A4AF
MLAGLLAGLPLLLWLAAGNPIPQHSPSAEQIIDTLARPAADDTLILTAARAIAWLLWTALCVSTALETAAHARGRHAPHLPGLGSIQHLTRKLVTSIALMTSTPSTVALAAAAAAPPAATAPVAVAPAADHQQAPQTPKSSDEHHVQRGDTLWDIAEDTLGDGERWPQIARLNDIPNPHLLQPDQTLQLPTRDHATKPSPDRPPETRHSQSPEPSSPPRTSVPSTPMPDSVPTASGTPWSSSHTPTAPDPGTDNTADDSAADGVDLAVVGSVFATGMVAGGVLTKLAVLRHTQRQHRRRGRRIRLTDCPRANTTERRLARQADISPDNHQAGRLLRAALRALSHGLQQAQAPPPAVVGVHLAGDTIEILLANPNPHAPPLFTVRPDSNDMCWQLTSEGRAVLLAHDAHNDVDDEADGHTDPLPGLISAGRTSSGGHLLVNLEALGVTGCTGPTHLVEALLRTIATEAATNPWSGWFDAILVGFDELAVIEGRVHTCDTLDDALTLVAWRADTIHHQLGDSPACGDVRDRRILGHTHDELMLTLLISRLPPTLDQLQQLLACVDNTGGVAAILPVPATADVPARFTLTTDPGGDEPVLRIDPLKLTVHPHPLTRDDYDDIVTLLTAAADTDDVAPDHPPYTAAPSTSTTPAWPAPHTDPPDHARPRPTGTAPGHEPEQPEPATGALLPFRSRTSGQHARSERVPNTLPEESATGPASPWTDRVVSSPPGSATSAAPPSPPSPTATKGAHGHDLPRPDDIPLPGRSASQEPGPVSAPDSGASPPPQETMPGLQIRILGPLEITGAERDLQPKQVEIVLLLALNTPTGLRNDQLRTLLGPDPDHPRGSDSFRQAITRSRRRLGTAADGQERIQHIGNGVYRLHDAELDWQLFQSLVEQAIGRGAVGITDLRQALDLVRGRPLEGAYYWWIDTPLLETMRATIVDAAELLADLELAAGHPAGAARAAHKGLIADPAAEQLWRMKMRAEHAAGNSAGVHDAWSACLHELATIDADLEPHPDTVALYRTLTGKPSSTASGQ